MEDQQALPDDIVRHIVDETPADPSVCTVSLGLSASPCGDDCDTANLVVEYGTFTGRFTNGAFVCCLPAAFRSRLVAMPLAAIPDAGRLTCGWSTMFVAPEDGRLFVIGVDSERRYRREGYFAVPVGRIVSTGRDVFSRSRLLSKSLAAASACECCCAELRAGEAAYHPPISDSEPSDEYRTCFVQIGTGGVRDGE